MEDIACVEDCSNGTDDDDDGIVDCADDDCWGPECFGGADVTISTGQADFTFQKYSRTVSVNNSSFTSSTTYGGTTSYACDAPSIDSSSRAEGVLNITNATGSVVLRNTSGMTMGTCPFVVGAAQFTNDGETEANLPLFTLATRTGFAIIGGDNCTVGSELFLPTRMRFTEGEGFRVASRTQLYRFTASSGSDTTFGSFSGTVNTSQCGYTTYNTTETAYFDGLLDAGDTLTVGDSR
ncbi:MAG: hypothetical protein ACJARS_003921 [bacterium]